MTRYVAAWSAAEEILSFWGLSKTRYVAARSAVEGIVSFGELSVDLIEIYENP